MRTSGDLPVWVEPPPTTEGSIDPLGDQAAADAIAERLLPGLTVGTTRARYLSFLCWARWRGLTEADTDRWEAALAIGEFLRHGPQETGDPGRCSYLGIRRVEKVVNGGAVPRRITRNTSRIVYRTLLASTGLSSAEGLSRHGEKLAEHFDRAMGGKRRVPARASSCEGLPCLSDPYEHERRLLDLVLLGDSAEGQQRARTFREMGAPLARACREGPRAILLAYLGSVRRGGEGPAADLRQAAVLELTSLPLRVLFLHLYASRGKLPRGGSARGRSQLYTIRAEGPELRADVRSHLTRARRLGGESLPLDMELLKEEVLRRHHEAKPEAPWVDERWRVLRPGLAPRSPVRLHGFRLAAFSSLLRDIGMIR